VKDTHDGFYFESNYLTSCEVKNTILAIKTKAIIKSDDSNIFKATADKASDIRPNPCEVAIFDPHLNEINSSEFFRLQQTIQTVIGI